MTMTRNKIEAARAEARRFITKADAALARIDEEVAEQQGRFRDRYGDDATTVGPQPGDQSWGSAETGALRRASLDLTRNLAELRK